MSDKMPGDDVKHIRTKISKTIETGYRCSVCGSETVVYGCETPPVCLKCGHPNPVKIWQDEIMNQTTVKSLM